MIEFKATVVAIELRPEPKAEYGLARPALVRVGFGRRGGAIPPDVNRKI